MLNELERKLNENTYTKIGRSKIFCIAVKQMYDRVMKESLNEK